MRRLYKSYVILKGVGATVCYKSRNRGIKLSKAAIGKVVIKQKIYTTSDVLLEPYPKLHNMKKNGNNCFHLVL